MSDQPTADERAEAEVRRIAREEIDAARDQGDPPPSDPPPDVDPDDVAEVVEDELGKPDPPPDDDPDPPPDDPPDEPVAADETPPDQRGPLAGWWFGDGDE